MFALARKQSSKRYEALRIWINSKRTKKPSEIAKELDVSAGLVRKWKSVDRWDDIPERRGPGAPYRNKNAVGNKGGPGGPPGNDKAVKHGLFRKLLPDDPELLQIYDLAGEMSPLDIVYHEIKVMFTNLIRAQKIQYVKDAEDDTRILKKQKRQMDTEKVGKGENQQIVTYESYVEEEWEIHTAADKQAKALTAQAAAMRALNTKIKQYEQMIRELPPNEVQAEHRLRIDKLKADLNAAKAKAW